MHSASDSCICICRVKKAAPGSAVFETVSEAQFSGRVTERAGGKGVTATSGIVAYLDAEGLPGALTFGVRDLKVQALNRLATFCCCSQRLHAA